MRLCCYSMVGQCLFYHFGKPVMERLSNRRFSGHGRMRSGSPRHIAKLTLAGIREIPRRANGKGGAAMSWVALKMLVGDRRSTSASSWA